MPHGALDLNAHSEYAYFVLTKSTRIGGYMQVSRDTKPTSLRFIGEIREFFKKEAGLHGRSFNSEVMQALKHEMEYRIEKQKQAA